MNARTNPGTGFAERSARSRKISVPLDNDTFAAIRDDALRMGVSMAEAIRQRIASQPEALALVSAAVEAERAAHRAERPFIMGANHGYDAAMEQVAEEARRFAAMYGEGSDGRNTFIIFAEWAEKMIDGPAFPDVPSKEPPR
jgi:hypothetical protein